MVIQNKSYLDVGIFALKKKLYTLEYSPIEQTLSVMKIIFDNLFAFGLVIFPFDIP